MKNGRGKVLGEEKMAIPRRHLVEKIPASDVCDRAGINDARHIIAEPQSGASLLLTPVALGDFDLEGDVDLTIR